MRALPLAALLTLFAGPALAEQEYGTGSQLPPAQHPQGWKDAGSPWKDAGREFKQIWSGVTNDARTIAPATREQFQEKPRWSWSPGGDTGQVYENAPTQSIRLRQTGAPTGTVYLPAQPAPQYVPQETYVYQEAPIQYAPVETAPYVGSAPAYAPVQPYQMAPIPD